MLILFQPACFSSSGSDLFNIRKINSKFSQRCLFHLPQVAFVFPALPPFFFKDSDFLIKYPFYSCEVSSFLFVNVLTRWFSCRCSTSSIFSILFFSGGFNSNFVDHILSSFQCFLMPVQFLIIHFSLFICSGVLKISQRFMFSTLHSFKIFRGCYLIQAF